VTPAKGLWHCMSCGAAGNVIQFVARKENITEKQAALQLMSALPGVMRGDELAAPRAVDPLQHVELMRAIVAHYHECLLGRGRRGRDYLASRGLDDAAMLAHFKVGFVDGSLRKSLSKAQCEAAKACGLFNERGNEKFYQRVVVPVFDERGRAAGLYGRDITGRSEVKHLYLSGPHRAVWNAEAARVYPDGILIAESLFDALAIWKAGHKNVIACYGAGGWTPHHDELMARANVRRVTFAFDADAAGDERALQLARALDARGVPCHRLAWPDGVKDACDYFAFEKGNGFRGTAESFAALLERAARIGFTRDESSSPAVADGASSTPERVQLIERTEEASVFQNGVLRYRVKGLGGNGTLRVVLTAMSAEAKHVDQLDLYGARARRGFAATCAERFALDVEKIEGDLLALVEALENLQREAKAVPMSGQQRAPMTDAERARGMELLCAKTLLDRVADDLDLIGYVGEPRNKKLAYLIATSRQLPKPLSGIFRAQSGCGKSFLMECVAELMPPEDVHYFSRLTPQALYYLEADALKHKLLIVDERNGSEESEYPIRTLQTRCVLKLAVPIKDPNSGKIKTSVLEIHGPIAYMESTTDARINPENANRCFELYLDESEAQTRAIFAAQRRARSLDGWRNERAKAEVLRAHHAAQRLLRPLKVIIPFVDCIEFPASWLRGRRDNDRFLSLIEGTAFLHQQQRRIGNDGGAEFIEASIEDYAMAYDLAHQVFSNTLADMPKPLASFWTDVQRIVAAEAKKARCQAGAFLFNRRLIRETTRLPDHIVKRSMRALEELEYVEVQRTARGGSFRYRLSAGDAPAPALDGLITPEALAQKWDKWNKSGTHALSHSKS